MIRAILDRLIILFNPQWWNMNNSYDIEWDKKLNELMKTHKFKPDDRYGQLVSTHYIILGEYSIWVENYPYAAFTRPSTPISTKARHIPYFYSETRPSRLTIMRAKRKMKYDLLPQQEKRHAKLNELMT